MNLKNSTVFENRICGILYAPKLLWSIAYGRTLLVQCIFNVYQSRRQEKTSRKCPTNQPMNLQQVLK